jgi:heme/copper-type cytochrome/quinol oxidase subunit 2
MAEQFDDADRPVHEGMSGSRAAIVGAALLLASPVLAFFAFGMAFFGFGLSPGSGGEIATVRDIVVVGMYLVVAATSASLLVAGPLVWIARGRERHVLARRTTRIAVVLVVVSAVILVVLAVAGYGFGQLAGI